MRRRPGVAGEDGRRGDHSAPAAIVRHHLRGCSCLHVLCMLRAQFLPTILSTVIVWHRSPFCTASASSTCRQGCTFVSTDREDAAHLFNIRAHQGGQTQATPAGVGAPRRRHRGGRRPPRQQSGCGAARRSSRWSRAPAGARSGSTPRGRSRLHAAAWVASAQPMKHAYDTRTMTGVARWTHEAHAWLW